MIASFKHECGCEFVRRANGYEQAYTCDTHGGSLSFGGAQAAPVGSRALDAALSAQQIDVVVTHCVTQRSPDDRAFTFTFTEAEARRLAMLASCEHYDVLMERRKLVQVQERMRDDSWSNRIAELNAEDTLMRAIVGKLLRRD